MNAPLSARRAAANEAPAAHSMTLLAQIERRAPLVLGLMMLACLGLLVLRMRGLYPHVFADELIYSTNARLQPLKDAILPSYLYFALFGATNACGPAYLSCARGLNIVLFVAAAPFIYATARQFCSRPAALGVTAFALFAPVQFYAFYFMPEAMYVFGMWALTWFALTRRHWSAPAFGLVLGTLFALLAMVKVHAMFVLPAAVVFMLWLGWRERRQGLRALGLRLLGIVLLVASFAAVREGLGYLFAGPAGMSLLGTFYSGGASEASQFERLLRLLPPALLNLRGQMLALVLLFPLPLAVLAWLGLARPLRGQPDRTDVVIGAVLLLGAPFALTVGFTALTALAGGTEGLRLHLRYYSYALPLLLMVTAAALNTPAAARRSLRAAVAIAAAAGLWYAFHYLRVEFLPNFVDSPEIAAYFAWPHPEVFAIVQALLLAWWVWQPLPALRVYLVGFLPVFAIYLVGGMQPQVNNMRFPVDGDNAGIYAREHVPPAQHGRIAIAGTELSRLMRAKFQVDHPAVQLIELAEGAPLDLSQIGRDSEWLVVLGRHAFPPEAKVLAEKPDFAFAHLDNRYTPLITVDLNKPLPPGGPVTSIEGLSFMEPWGTWTEGTRLVIHLRDPAPQHLHLVLRGRAYGPNAGRDVVVHAGAATGHFRFAGDLRDATVRLQTDGQQREIVLDIPAPASPESRGESSDKRTLGLGLVQIVIGETVVAPLP